MGGWGLYAWQYQRAREAVRMGTGENGVGVIDGD